MRAEVAEVSWGLQPWTAEEGLCILDLMNLAVIGTGITGEIMHRLL